MLTTWLTVATICTLGAVTPGPSLAVIMRHTLAGGRARGCIAALAHGVGFGLYALLALSGLAVLITTSPTVYRAFQWAGAAYIIWLGIKGLMAKPAAPQEAIKAETTSGAVRDGFMIAFLNPKIAVFLIALFSQVIAVETSWPEKSLYVTTAWFIDTAWYLVVAWLFSNPRWLTSLQQKAVWLERAFGIVLIALAARLIFESIQ